MRTRLIAMIAILGAFWVASVADRHPGLLKARSHAQQSNSGFPAYEIERDAYEGWLTDDDQSNMAAALASLHRGDERFSAGDGELRTSTGAERRRAPAARGAHARPRMSAAAAHGSKRHDSLLAIWPWRAHHGIAILIHMTCEPEIIGGPTHMDVPRPGDTYRWKVQDGAAEKHVYVQIADALRPEAFGEPLRSGIESKGGSVLAKLLAKGDVPVRIKITSAGITQVGVDRRARPCAM